MTNRYDQAVNFVAAEPSITIEPAQTSLIKRGDVVNVVDRMIDGYMTQQRGLLDQVQGETTHAGFLSGADQVAERRRTSRLYLGYYLAVTATVSGGLVLLAHGAGFVDAGGSFATWLALTGGLAALIGYRRHGDELALTPESIALRVVDAHENVALYESETRRLSLQWEFDAEERRQAAQERAAEHGRQLAELRVKELDARRRTIEAQTERRMYAEPAQTAIAGAGRTEAALQVSAIESDDATPTGGATLAGWQAALVTWVVTLYEPGAITEGGIIKGRVPWAQRSPWVDADKQAALRACCTLRPALIEQADGGRWRLRREMFTDADQAMYILSPRLIDY